MKRSIKRMLSFWRCKLTACRSLTMMPAEYLKIGLVVITYWAISISLVFANKFLVGSRTSEHNVALFTAWIQCMVTVICTFIITGVKTLVNPTSSFKLNLRKLYSPHIMILTCTYVGMLTFNNLCLRYVNVSFYQIARSLTLIFVVIFSLIILKKSVSWKVWVCCIAVAGGFILGIDQENLSGTLSFSGVLFGVVTSLFVSLNGIFTKKALDVVDRDSVELTLLNNINAIVLFVPFVIGTGQLKTAWEVEYYHTPFFWGFLIITGILAFAIAWISAVQIDLTSPVTHHISANLKAVLQTIIAVAYHKEQKGFFWWVSIFMVIGGALAYAQIRILEEKKQSAELLEKHTSDVESGKVVQNGKIPSGNDIKA